MKIERIKNDTISQVCEIYSEVSKSENCEFAFYTIVNIVSSDYLLKNTDWNFLNKMIEFLIEKMNVSVIDKEIKRFSIEKSFKELKKRIDKK